MVETEVVEMTIETLVEKIIEIFDVLFLHIVKVVEGNGMENIEDSMVGVTKIMTSNKV